MTSTFYRLDISETEGQTQMVANNEFMSTTKQKQNMDIQGFKRTYANDQFPAEINYPITLLSCGRNPLRFRKHYRLSTSSHDFNGHVHFLYKSQISSFPIEIFRPTGSNVKAVVYHRFGQQTLLLT